MPGACQKSTHAKLVFFYLMAHAPSCQYISIIHTALPTRIRATPIRARLYLVSGQLNGSCEKSLQLIDAFFVYP